MPSHDKPATPRNNEPWDDSRACRFGQKAEIGQVLTVFILQGRPQRPVRNSLDKRMKLGLERHKVFQAAAQAIDVPGHHYVELPLAGVPAQRIERRPPIADGLKVDSDVSSGIELRVCIRRNDAGRVIFFYDQRSGAPCRKVRAPDDGRSHPPAPATEIGFTWR